MRDKKRIERILRKLGHVWMLNPDYRFGQLLINIGFIEDDFGTWNAECKQYEERLDEILKNDNS